MSDSSGNWPKWIEKAGNIIKNVIQKVTSRMTSNSTKVSTTNSKKANESKLRKTANAAWNNVDASVGVGLGLYGETTICDVVGVGIGINYNLVECRLDDGKVSVVQSYTYGLSITAFGVEAFEGLSESGTLKMSSEGWSGFVTDEYNQSVSIGKSAYFIAGGSANIGFDIISFFEEIEKIYFYE